MGRGGSTSAPQSISRRSQFTRTVLAAQSRQSRTARHRHTHHLSTLERVGLPHNRNRARIQACFYNPRFSLCRHVVAAARGYETAFTPFACLCVEPLVLHFVS